MAEAATRLMTFEEFTALDLEGRYELVNGKLEELVSPKPRHGWTGGKIFSLLDPYLEQYDPRGFWAVELDIPTVPYSGRRPDFAYFSGEDAAKRVDLDANRVTGVPTLVVEVISDEDAARDLVVKREEYARAGIPHYWILDPSRKTVATLELRDGAYAETGILARGEVLTTPLFPGLKIELDRLFR
ncbi:MAG: Uma2 family endonuclease [Armatimonadota bacterium]